MLFKLIEEVLSGMNTLRVILDYEIKPRSTDLVFRRWISESPTDHTTKVLRSAKLELYAAATSGERILCSAHFKTRSIDSVYTRQKREYDIAEDRISVVLDIIQWLRTASLISK